MISSLFSSGSPPQPSPASVTTTATSTTATSSPTTANQSKTNTLSSSSSSGHPTGGGPSTTTSVSSPPAGAGAAPPPLPAAAARAPRSNATTTASHIQPSLPSPRSQRAEADARAAVVASISNMLDGELQSRAALLHANNAAIDKQRRDVEKAVAALRKEDDKLQKVADDAARRVKEVGDVQNWAELLEKDFLVLEETLRLAAHGGGSGCSDGCDSCCSGSYYSGSYSGSEAGDAVAKTDAEGDVAMDGEGGRGDGESGAAALSDELDDGSDMLDKKGKGKELVVADASESMELDEPHHNMSEASRSITDASSSHTMTNETGKSSETTSLCAPTTGV